MIERLALPPAAGDLRRLAELLTSAVQSGAAVSFVSPFSVADAEAWWHRTLTAADGRAVVLVAREAGEIVATVQLHPAWAPNQPHRAEVVKLLVDARYRNRGLGARLMQALERAAFDDGFRLLTLDAKAGTAADRLYRRLGWIPAGTIPGYAVDPDGVTPHDAVFFYKILSPDSAAANMNGSR